MRSVLCHFRRILDLVGVASLTSRMRKTRWERGFRYYTAHASLTTKDLLPTTLKFMTFGNYKLVCEQFLREGYKMKQWLTIILTVFVYVSIKLIDCQPSNDSGVTTQSSLIDDQCPLLHFFNAITNLCECSISSSISDIVKCTEGGVRLRLGYCMTHEEQEEGSSVIYIARCNYFNGRNLSTTDNGYYIELSVRNPSELNDRMCTPMNRSRNSTLCSECSEGFGPSIISLGLVCSDCTGVWYGVPLYLFLEFVPITIFYVIILLFSVSITSAPMVAFVFYSQILVSTFLNYGNELKFANHVVFHFIQVYITFYGIWNLDFIRYILPPFCVSESFKNIHIIVIGYVSAFFPLCLIFITWIAIKLHYYNFKPIVWLWSKVQKCACSRAQDHSHEISRSNSLIDVFTTFFLLSFSKLVYTSTRILLPLKAMVYVNKTIDESSTSYHLSEDPSINYFKGEHRSYALISIFILLMILPPVALLILYPINMFRSLLFKCHLSTRKIASLNIFVEKYYSCYRDGTGGGRDMRSLASMYFILRVIAILVFQLTSLDTSLTVSVVLYTSYGIIIALIRPYKKTYMNVTDTLIMANLALLALMVNKLYLEDSNTKLGLFYAIIIAIFSVLPLLSLTGFIAYRILRRIKNELDLFRTKMERKEQSSKTTTRSNPQQDLSDDPELPDRVLHPQQYTFLRMKKFSNVNYVKA